MKLNDASGTQSGMLRGCRGVDYTKVRNKRKKKLLYHNWLRAEETALELSVNVTKIDVF